MKKDINMVMVKDWNSVTKSDLEFLALKRSYTKTQIADLFNVSKNQVRYKLKKHNIRIQENMLNDSIKDALKATKKMAIQDLIFASDSIIEETAETELYWGPVKVTKGKFKGRIGCFDDDEGAYGYVYWGNMISSLDAWNKIKLSYLSNNITTYDLVKRLNDLENMIARMRCKQQFENSAIENYEIITNLYGEYVYAMGLLNKIYEDTFYLENESDKKVFLSYSSRNKDTALQLATDLKRAKYKVWFDVWNIEGGHSIPKEISNGIETSDALIMLVSKDYIESAFCRDEWESFYMRYNKTKPNSIIPIIIDDSEMPAILANRRYLKIISSDDYNEVLTELKRVLKKL